MPVRLPRARPLRRYAEVQYERRQYLASSSARHIPLLLLLRSTSTQSTYSPQRNVIIPKGPSLPTRSLHTEVSYATEASSTPFPLPTFQAPLPSVPARSGTPDTLTIPQSQPHSPHSSNSQFSSLTPAQPVPSRAATLLERNAQRLDSKRAPTGVKRAINVPGMIRQLYMNTRLKRVFEVFSIVHQLRSTGVPASMDIYYCLLATYQRAIMPRRALETLQEMYWVGIKPDLFCFNECILACAHRGEIYRSNAILDLMRAENVGPDENTYFYLIWCMIKAAEIGRAIDVLKTCISSGNRPLFNAYERLVAGCIAHKRVDDVKHLVRLWHEEYHIPGPSLVPLLEFYATNDEVDSVREIWEELESVRNESATFHLYDSGLILKLLEMYSRVGRPTDALQIMKSYLMQGGKIRQEHFECIIDAHVNANDIKTAFRMFRLMRENGFEPDYRMSRVMLRKLCVNSDAADAAWIAIEQLAQESPTNVDVEAVNVVLEACRLLRDQERTFGTFQAMLDENVLNVDPNTRTINILLSLCARNSNFETSMKLYETYLKAKPKQMEESTGENIEQGDNSVKASPDPVTDDPVVVDQRTDGEQHQEMLEEGEDKNVDEHTGAEPATQWPQIDGNRQPFTSLTGDAESRTESDGPHMSGTEPGCTEGDAVQRPGRIMSPDEAGAGGAQAENTLPVDATSSVPGEPKLAEREFEEPQSSSQASQAAPNADTDTEWTPDADQSGGGSQTKTTIASDETKTVSEPCGETYSRDPGNVHGDVFYEHVHNTGISDEEAAGVIVMDSGNDFRVVGPNVFNLFASKAESHMAQQVRELRASYTSHHNDPNRPVPFDTRSPIQPDAESYLHLIAASMYSKSPDQYEKAFEFLEEMKERGILPTLTIYKVIVIQCLHERDMRYKVALEEMKDLGYVPDRRMLNVIGELRQQGLDVEVPSFTPDVDILLAKKSTAPQGGRAYASNRSRMRPPSSLPGGRQDDRSPDSRERRLVPGSGAPRAKWKLGYDKSAVRHRYS